MYYDALKRRVKEYKAVKRAVRDNKSNIMDIIAPVYQDLHYDVVNGLHETYNLPGGRGSCKSSFVALEIINGIMEDKTANAAIFRQVGATLRDSVFNQIQWAIDELGVSDLWVSNVNPMQYIYKPTKQVIMFRGLDKPTKVKSIKPKHGYFKYLWFEEFSEIPGANTIRSVRQSVLRGGDKYVVFNSFNPPLSRNNWANKYVEEPNDKAVTFRTTYKDVPAEWLGESFIDEAERLKEINEKAYQNEYLGEAVGTGGEVFPNIEVRTITDEEIQKMQYIYCGVDFGFSSDPTVYIRLSYDSKTETIYFLDEIYQTKLHNAELAGMIKEKGYDLSGEVYQSNRYGYFMPEKQVTICDCAEPRSISDLNDNGIKAIPCKKYPGCVNYRIKWLQSRRIVIDSKRTPHAYKEFTEYEYEVTKDGEQLSSVPDKNNHSIDAVSYALDRVIYNRNNSA